MIYTTLRYFELDGLILMAFLAYTLYILCGSEQKHIRAITFVPITVCFYALLYYVIPAIFPVPFTPMFSSQQHPFWYYFCCTITAALLCSGFLLKNSFFSKLVYTLFFMTFVQLYKIVCSPLYSQELFMSKDLYSRLDMLTTLLLYFLLFLLTRLFRRVKLSATVQLLPRKWFLTLYFPISFLLFFWLRSSGIFLFSSYTEAILSGIILTNLPIIYFLYASIIQTYEEQRALDKALTQTKAQLSRYRYSIELEEQLKKERHELKNHYFYMQTLLKEQKHEELEHYLEEITGEKLASISTISTGNVLMDYLLNKKMKETQKYHIKTYTEILVPEQLHVNDDVLCTILLNLLDNAIEASRQEESSDIHITIKCIPDYLICKISNKVSRDILLENPNLHTTKSDPQNHGLGMKIIKDAVDSCNGIFHTSMEDNYFTASVMLPLNN